MGSFNELGQSKQALLKLAHTQLQRINGHTTLWTGTLPEGVDTDTGDASSYYGNYALGPAVHSEFREKSFPVAVSFSVPEGVNGLPSSFVLNKVELNPPEVLLTKEKLKAHEDAVLQRQQKPPAPDANSATRGEQPREPTDAQILIKANLIVSAHPEAYNLYSKDGFNMFLEWLRIEMNWKVSESRVKALLLPRARLVSMGEIPVGAIEEAYVEAKERQYTETIALPTRKGQEAKQSEEPWTEEQKKEHRKAQKLAMKRLAPPTQSIHQMLHSRVTFEQQEGVVVKMIFHEDPNDRSYMRLRFTHKYKDASRAEEQPSHKTDVDLTYRNTRPRGQLPNPKGDIYVPSEHILDVSDRIFIPYLARLFPHLTRKDPRYWQKLFANNHTLTLFQFRQNELPMTNNVFTPRVDVPSSYNDLRIIMRHAPIIYVLVRGKSVDDIARSIFNRFGELASFNPLSRFFVDAQNPYINNKGIKATEDLPKFITLSENAFEDWKEFSTHCGVATVIELRYGMWMQLHEGIASAHPVPHTQYTENGKTIDLSLFLNFVEERTNKELPRLVVGDLVEVDFNIGTGHTQSEHTWKGRVVHPTLSTGIGQICIIADRPFSKEEGILDTKPYTTLTVKEMEAMTAEQLSDWASKNQDLKIIVIKRGSESECKRLCNGLSNMEIPTKLLPTYQGKERILKQFRTFLMCKDHSQYDMSSLFQTLHPKDHVPVLDALRSSLRDYQMEPINHWLNQGVTSNVVALAGISGSGKTYTSISALCGYTFRVKVDREKRAMQEEDFARLVNGQTAQARKKAEMKANSGKPYGPDDMQGALEEIVGNDPEDIVGNDSENDEAESTHAEDLVKQICAGPLRSDDMTQEFEAGRVTHVSIQNETVDHNYETWCKRLSSICEITKAPPKLVVRLHSIQSERRALLAMVDPSFEPGASPNPRTIEINSELGGTVNMALLEHYLRAMRTEHPGITDKRFHAVHGSLSYVILQLARLSGIPLTNEVANTWNEQERNAIANELSSICDAYNECQADGQISDDTRKQVKRAFKTGYQVVIQRASVVCSTLAVVTTSSFQMHRKAHAVALEEAGRAIDLDIATLLSTHWACDLIMLIGDWRQLGFTPYGPQLDNPFQSQLGRSTFSRLNFTGFPIQVLTHTSRFTSNPLLFLCGRLNNESRICAVPGSFNIERESEAKRVNEKIWGKSSVIVVVNTENATAQRDMNGSWYSIQTALTTMHDVVQRLQDIPGENVMVITPYNAQLSLLMALRDTAQRNAVAVGNATLADELSRVMIITVDSSMGKDREHVVFDTVGHADGFLWRQPRTLVAGTRARSSFIFIGPTYHYSSRSKVKDRLKSMLHVWDSEGLIVGLSDTKLSTFEQYKTVQTALKLSQISSYNIPKNYRQAPMGVDISADNNTGPDSGWGASAEGNGDAGTDSEW